MPSANHLQVVDEDKVKDFAFAEAQGKLSPELKSYLRDNIPDKWNSALKSLIVSIDAEEDLVKQKSEIDRKPVDLQLFKMKWDWVKRDLQAKLGESQKLLEEKRQVTMTTAMVDLVGEFKKIRQLLEKVVK